MSFHHILTPAQTAIPGGVMTVDSSLYEPAAYDIVGDVHGCYDELVALLNLAGWEISLPGTGSELTTGRHPEGRLLVFAGDLTDRGPASDLVLRLALGMMAEGTAVWTRGNHDDKFARALRGNKVIVSGGLDRTLQQIDHFPVGLRQHLSETVSALPHQIRLPMPAEHPRAGDGLLTVVHAAAPEKYLDAISRKAFDRSIYGYPDDTKPDGTLRRLDWAADYAGERWIVHGHEPLARHVEKNRVLDIDTGCVFGYRLTMFRVDTESFLSVEAAQDYSGKGRVLP